MSRRTRLRPTASAGAIDMVTDEIQMCRVYFRPRRNRLRSRGSV